jgi:hypothetical protein
MIKFEFDSHEQTPEDQYVKEIVTFKFTADGESWYVPYFHKTMKDGGAFWSPSSAGVQVFGKKKYFEGFMLDSRHRNKLIMDFLTERRWEKQQQHAQTQGEYYPHGMAKQAPVSPPTAQPTSMDEVIPQAQQDDLPF